MPGTSGNIEVTRQQCGVWWQSLNLQWHLKQSCLSKVTLWIQARTEGKRQGQRTSLRQKTYHIYLTALKGGSLPLQWFYALLSPFQKHLKNNYCSKPEVLNIVLARARLICPLCSYSLLDIQHTRGKGLSSMNSLQKSWFKRYEISQ